MIEIKKYFPQFRQNFMINLFQSCLKRNFVAENARKAKAAPIRVDPMKVEDARAAKKKEDESKCYQRGTVPE